MRSFQHLAAPLRLYSGPDSLGHIDRELKRLDCRRAVIVCGATMSRSPLLARLREAMGERCAGVFGGVRAHSPLPAVLEGVAALRAARADAAVAVGGGSAVVTARAMAILLAETGSLAELATSIDAAGRVTSPRLLAPKIPQFVVPTTPATAAVKAGTAVLDPQVHARFALFDPRTRAQALFVHPDMLLSASRDLTVSASLDTFTLALEGLTARGGDPVADALLIHALRLAAQHLPREDLATNAEARVALMMAAILCGQGTDFTGAGVATVLGHAIGAIHETENGLAKAIVLPHALRFNGEASPEGLRKIATGLGLQPTSDSPLAAIIAAIERLFGALGVPRRLRDAKVSRESLSTIAARGMGDWFLRGNPRPVREAAELEEILSASW